MAETLGSLIDKLTIKTLREYHLKDMQKHKQPRFTKKDVASKLTVLRRQKKYLFSEITDLVAQATVRRIPLKDEKIKLYNKPETMDRVGKVNTLARAIEQLCEKNIMLWHLEDEARREDVNLAYIGQVKRKIDRINQKRNDFIDLIDVLFEKELKKHKKNRVWA